MIDEIAFSFLEAFQRLSVLYPHTHSLSLYLPGPMLASPSLISRTVVLRPREHSGAEPLTTHAVPYSPSCAAALSMTSEPLLRTLISMRSTSSLLQQFAAVDWIDVQRPLNTATTFFFFFSRDRVGLQLGMHSTVKLMDSICTVLRGGVV